MQTEDQQFYTRQESKLLKDFDGVIRLVKGEMVSRYGAELTEEMILNARREYQRLIPELPYVGEKPPLTQFVITTGWCLALYRTMASHAISARESGEVFFVLTRRYIEKVPGLARRLLGESMFTQRYQRKLREVALDSQQHPLPRGYIFSHVEGDGVNFNFGVDYHRCATLNFLSEQGGEEIAPYMCTLDYLSSEMLGWGLMRTSTLAEGGKVCDFRFKKGGPTRIHSSVMNLGL